jgi:hypothetical protein
MSFIATAKTRRLSALRTLGRARHDRPTYQVAPCPRAGLPGLVEKDMDRMLGICATIEAERANQGGETGPADVLTLPIRPRRALLMRRPDHPFYTEADNPHEIANAA